MHGIKKVYILSSAFILFLSCQLNAQTNVTDKIIDKCQAIINGADGNPTSFKELIELSTKTLTQNSGLKNSSLCRLNYYAGIGYYNLHLFDSARYFFENCTNQAIDADKGDVAAYALGSLVNIYNYLGTDTKSDSAALLLQTILDTTKNNSTLSVGYYALGNFHVKARSFFNLGLNELLLGLKALKPILDTGTSNKNKIYHDAISIAIADIYFSLKQYDKSLQYLFETEKYVQLSVPTTLGFYCRLVKNYAAIKNIDSALFYQNKLEQAIIASPGEWSEPISTNLAIFDYYLAEGKIDFAKKYLDTAVVKANETDVLVMIAEANAAQGKYFFTQNDFDSAKKYFELSATPMYNIDKDTYCNIRKHLAEIALKTSNIKEAQKQVNLYSTAIDSLVDEKVSKNLAEMEAIYQNNAKRSQLAVQATELKYAGKQRVWLILGIAILALLAVLLFAFYRNKKRNADALAKINYKLEEANQTKAKLFSIISHDLRSPISQVYQFLKLQQLNPQSLNETQRNELSNKIQSATGSLLETMEDLLLWSKTQMNEFNASKESLSLLPLVETCKQLLQLNIDSKHLKIVNTISEDVQVYADLYFLQTIIRNLFQNAVKASPQQETIFISSIISAATVVLSIENKGGSFTQEQYENLLSDKKMPNGLNGLGLRLVDDLSNRLGVKINFIPSAKVETTIVNITIPTA